MKVIYRTKLSVDEVKTRLSENIVLEQNYEPNQKTFIGKMDGTNSFNLNTAAYPDRLSMNFAGTITQINNETLIEIEIKTSDKLVLFVVVINVLLALVGIIIDMCSGFVNPLNILIGIIFFDLLHFLSNFLMKNKLKMDLKDFFDAEIVVKHENDIYPNP
jgi:hypothetical protein